MTAIQFSNSEITEKKKCITPVFFLKFHPFVIISNLYSKYYDIGVLRPKRYIIIK